MNTEDYVSCPIAVALKECGFDEPCDLYKVAIPDTLHEVWDKEEQRYHLEEEYEYYPKITLWHAQKWLREEKNWHIIVEPLIWESLTYEFKLWHKFRGYENANRGFYFSSYERALSAGISAALELIKKGV